MDPATTDESLQKLSNILSTKYYLVAASTLLIYDFILSFPDEIRYAWKARKTPATILFFLNRYFSLSFCIVILTSYFLPGWSEQMKICNRFVVTQFVQTVIIFTVAELFLSLRVHVLTRKNKIVTAVLVLHILTQLILAFYIFSRQHQATSATHTPNPIEFTPEEYKAVENSANSYAFQICELFPVPDAFELSVAYLCLALSFDIVIFVLTLSVTLATRNQWYPTLNWINVIQRDGVIFFIAIFSCTLLWTVMVFKAPPSLKLITAEPDMVFISVLVNRMYLSLREAGQQDVEISKMNESSIPLEILVARHTVTSVL